MLNYIYRWWKDLNFARELPFIRDRIVECYFWIVGVYFEPEYLLARRILTKVIAMNSVIDDIYDVYGIPEELELFTEAIERLKFTHSLILISYFYSNSHVTNYHCFILLIIILIGKFNL
jgi:hypothetical protein